MLRPSISLKNGLAFTLALLGATTASAQTTWYVDNDSALVPPGNGTLQSPYTDIQAAINAPSTANGDSIEVASSLTYPGFSFGTKLLRIYGIASNPQAPLASLPAISGGPNASCVSFPGPVGPGQEDAQTLEGFNLYQGNSTFGGGIDVVASQPTIRNVHVYQCTAVNGSGISFRNSEGIVEDCDITSNQGLAGPGLQQGGGVYLDRSGVTFRNCRIEGNFVDNPNSFAPAEGGGVWISGNDFFNPLGGLRNRFIDCTISGNLAAHGAGVYVENQALPRFVRCKIQGNFASIGPAGTLVPSRGGGGYVSRACPEFESCVISDNVAAGDGARGGGFYFENGSTAFCGASSLNNCTVAYNEAGSNGFNVFFGSGGGFYIDSTPVNMERSILAFNTVGTLAGNTPQGPQASILNSGGIAEPLLAGNSIAIEGTQPFFDLGAPSSSFQTVIAGDPVFQTATGTALAMNSPLVDSLSTGFLPAATARDIDSEPRLVGTAVDYGADEYIGCNSSTEYGSPLPNSTGATTHLSSSGSQSLAMNNLSLDIDSGPANTFGLFLYGYKQVSFPAGSGIVLAGGDILRVQQALVLDGSGSGSLLLDLTKPVFARIVADTNWNFQYWHRDAVNGMVTTNYSNGLNLYFCQ